MRCVGIGVSKAACNFRMSGAAFLTSLRAILPMECLGAVVKMVHRQFHRESCLLRWQNWIDQKDQMNRRDRCSTTDIGCRMFPTARLAAYEKNVTGGNREERECLFNARLPLEPAHILHNLIDIPWSHAFDLRHIAELPMMCLDAVGRSPLEGRIAVMIRLVDLVH